MIKARLNRGKGKRDLILLGISEGNVVRLKQGKPILVLGPDVKQHDVDITIVYGETEAAIAAELRESGLNLPQVPDLQPGQERRYDGDSDEEGRTIGDPGGGGPGGASEHDPQLDRLGGAPGDPDRAVATVAAQDQARGPRPVQGGPGASKGVVSRFILKVDAYGDDAARIERILRATSQRVGGTLSAVDYDDHGSYWLRRRWRSLVRP